MKRIIDSLDDLGRFSEPALLIMISLADGPKHGYAMTQDIEQVSGQKLGPGTLYGAIARLEEREWIEALPAEDRRRPYKLTGAGHQGAEGAPRQPARDGTHRQRPPRGAVMTARQLLQLYPRAWRERYGEEFVETVGARPLNAQQAIDIVGGAIDAWITFKSATTRLRTPGGGEIMTQQWKAICATSGVRYTKRDALISAGVMIAASFLLVAAGIYARSTGRPELGDALVSVSFPIALMVSMPFAILKGQPKTVQVVSLVFSTLILIIATWIATKI